MKGSWPSKRMDHKARYAIEFMRRMYWNAQEGKCALCGGGMNGKINSPKLNFDHVWPISNTQGTDPVHEWRGNVLLVHSHCNLAKANKRPTAEQVDLLREVNRRLGFPVGSTITWDAPISDEAAE